MMDTGDWVAYDGEQGKVEVSQHGYRAEIPATRFEPGP